MNLKEQSATLMDSTESFVIRKQEDMAFVNNQIKKAETIEKAWYLKTNPACVAAKKSHSANVELRDSVCKPLKSFVKEWKGKIALFLHFQKQKREKEEKRINDKLRERTNGDTPPIQIVVASQVEKPAGFVSRVTYHAECTDFAALSDDFKLPNQSKLDGLARIYKGGTGLKGVRFYKKVNGMKVDPVIAPKVSPTQLETPPSPEPFNIKID